MSKKDKIGVEFCKDLYTVLIYAINKQMNEDWTKYQNIDECYTCTEFEKFETMAQEIIPLYNVGKLYDNITSDLIGFAITKDIDDFITDYIDSDLLLLIRDKCNEQLVYNKMNFHEKFVDEVVDEMIRRKESLNEDVR